MDEKTEDQLLCYPSIENISEETEVSENTVLKYINILNELNILVFDYAGYRVLIEGKIKNGKMFYARCEDEEILLNRLRKERENNGFIKINKRMKDKSNLKKSIKQKINILEKKENLTNIEVDKLENLKLFYDDLNKTNNKETEN